MVKVQESRKRKSCKVLNYTWPLVPKEEWTTPQWAGYQCLDIASTYVPSTRSLFFHFRPPPATTNCSLAEPGGGPWVNCAWFEVSRGCFVGGRFVKAPRTPPPCAQASPSYVIYKTCHRSLSMGPLVSCILTGAESKISRY